MRLLALLVFAASLPAQSTFFTASYSASLGTVATPTVDNDTGSYSGSVTVTPSDATSGAAMFYCTSVGSDCSPVTSYSTPLVISVDTTHACFNATKSGWTTSGTKCATYTITSTPVDIAWDFRTGSGFVTDPSYATFSDTTKIYPLTSTINGTSVTWGWNNNTNIHGIDRSSSVDARIAGMIYQANDGTQTTFRADVPAGTYSLCLAAGDAAGPGARQNYITFKDGSTTRITMAPGGSPEGTTDSTHFRDATGAALDTTAWPGSNTCTSISIASGTLNVVVGSTGVQSDLTCIAHLRLTK